MPHRLNLALALRAKKKKKNPCHQNACGYKILRNFTKLMKKKIVKQIILAPPLPTHTLFLYKHLLVVLFAQNPVHATSRIPTKKLGQRKGKK